jgi:hypothetical protein
MRGPRKPGLARSFSRALSFSLDSRRGISCLNRAGGGHAKARVGDNADTFSETANTEGLPHVTMHGPLSQQRWPNGMRMDDIRFLFELTGTQTVLLQCKDRHLFLNPEIAAAQDVEGFLEPVGQFALPLEGKVGWADDEHALDKTPQLQFLEQ